MCGGVAIWMVNRGVIVHFLQDSYLISDWDCVPITYLIVHTKARYLGTLPSCEKIDLLNTLNTCVNHSELIINL